MIDYAYTDSDSSAVSREDMIANILATYDSATDSQRTRGQRWYPRMHSVATGRAARLNATVASVAGVYASFSVNTGWKQNLRFAANTLRGSAVRTLPGNIERAAKCLREGMCVADTLAPGSTARKIVAFAANIAGDYSRVTVDRWARRIAYADPIIDGVPNGAEYDSIEAAYVLAALLRDVEPAIMQAVTWVTLRDAS